MDKNKNYFFCGIGGIGMSGLAKIMAETGFSVFGSDMNESPIIESLRKIGVKVYIGHKAENLKGSDVFVYSAAIPKSNPEFIEAKEKGLEILSRSKFLGLLMKEKRGIAVSGTHGKTTTSTMLSVVLEESGFDPTIVVGGEVGNIGGNAKTGQGEYFVAEACEYERAFLDLYPYGAIITNIEADHLDTYKDLDDIKEAFQKFVTQVNKGGFLVVCSEDKNTLNLKNFYKGKTVTYGFSEADFVAEEIRVEGHKTFFEVKKNKNYYDSFELIIPGSHNILNALSVIATADYLGVDASAVKKSLARFTNAKRRYEIKGKKDGVLVIDDYAHHPTEIRATLAGIIDFYPEKKIWAVFQPHQYSRTRLLFEDFSESFKGIHKVIIPDIYEARDTEDDKKAVTSKMLAEAINNKSNNAEYIGKFSDVVQYLKENVRSGDLVLTVGAGPVYKIADKFLI